MSAVLPPLPTQAPLVELDDRQRPTPYLSKDWYLAEFQRDQRLQVAVQAVGGTPKFQTGKSASIATTSIPLAAVGIPTVQAGFYRINWYARVTQAASTSSSLSLTLTWIEHSVTLTSATAAVTGNTTTTVLQGSQVVYSDAPGPITYTTTYASVGATPMQYEIAVWAELIV